MMEEKFETLAIRTTKAMARKFEDERILLGFTSRAAYLWFLHIARKGAMDMIDSDRRVLLQLAHYGNFKPHRPTPDTTELAKYDWPAGHAGIDQVEKSLESLQMRGFVQEMATPILGSFSNDVITRQGRRYRVTPLGGEAIRALGYKPVFVG